MANALSLHDQVQYPGRYQENIHNDNEGEIIDTYCYTTCFYMQTCDLQAITMAALELERERQREGEGEGVRERALMAWKPQTWQGDGVDGRETVVMAGKGHEERHSGREACKGGSLGEGEAESGR